MVVSGTSSTSSSTSTSGTSSSSTVDYNAFLQLLIAQMKNQDPTSPTDSSQYLSQLASFSAVEQQTKTNTKLDALVTNSMLSQADGIIGRTVTSADGTQSGTVSSVTLTSSGLSATLADGSTMLVGSGVKVQ